MGMQVARCAYILAALVVTTGCAEGPAAARLPWARMAGAGLRIVVIEPQPGARHRGELPVAVDISTVGPDGGDCHGCVVLDFDRTEVCVSGGAGAPKCRRLDREGPFPNVAVGEPRGGLSTITVWVQTEAGGARTNVSVATTFLWASAEAAASELRARLAKASPSPVDDVALQLRRSERLHLAFALSQAGRWAQAAAALRLAGAEGARGAGAWGLALASGATLRRTWLTLDFVEVGCSTHRTVTQSLPAGSVARGLAVEPVRRHLAAMLADSAAALPLSGGGGRGLPGVVGVRAAVDEREAGARGADAEETRVVPIYYLKLEDVREYVVVLSDGAADPKRFLSPDVFGCNSVGAPHPFVERDFEQRGLAAPWSTEAVEVLTVAQLLGRWGSHGDGDDGDGGDDGDDGGDGVTVAGSQSPHRVGVFKVDVEGKDLAVLRSMLHHCAPNASSASSPSPFSSCPLAVQFEAIAGLDGGAGAGASGGGATQRDEALAALAAAGYRVVQTSRSNDVYLSRAAAPHTAPKAPSGGAAAAGSAGSAEEASCFAWCAPLGLVVDATAACAGRANSLFVGEEVRDPIGGHPFAAGLPAPACLLELGAS